MAGFKLNLEGKNLQSLAFITKFMTEFKKIGAINLGTNSFLEDERKNFNEALQKNLHLTQIEGGSRMDPKFKK